MGYAPNAFRNTILLSKPILGSFSFDLWGIRARFSKMFGWFWEFLGLLWVVFGCSHPFLALFSSCSWPGYLAARAGGATPPQTPPFWALRSSCF